MNPRHSLLRRPLALALFAILPLLAARAGELGPVVPISGADGQAAVPSAVMDHTGTLHVLWADGGSGKFDIFHRAVTQGVPGATRQISDSPGLSSGPKLVVTPRGMLYALWHDSTPPRTRIYMRGIGRGSVPVVLTPSTRGAFTPAVSAAPDGRLHVAWADRSPGNFDIRYRVVGAESRLTSSQNLSNNAGKSLVPSVATDACGTVYVAWHDDTSGNFEVYLRTSRDHGVTFGPVLNVSSSPGLSGAPALAAATCGTVYAFWPDSSSGNFEIMARRSTNHGRSLLPSQNLSSTPELSIRPAVKQGPEGVLHLAWIDGKSDYFDVYYRCMTPDLKRTSGALRISSGKGIAGAPSIDVAADGTAHVVWIDNETGPFRVFLRTVEDCSPK